MVILNVYNLLFLNIRHTLNILKDKISFRFINEASFPIRTRPMVEILMQYTTYTFAGCL